MTWKSYSYIPIKITVLATAAAYFLYKFSKSVFRDEVNNKVILIDNVQKWNSFEAEILETFRKSEVVGIDCEWVTADGKRKPISLLQLANKEGFCVLIRLSRIPVSLIPSGLAELLESNIILKVGVGVYEDVQKLFHDYCLEVNNFLDLRYLAKDLKELQGKNLGLKSLGNEVLDLDLNKNYSLRCSNWDAVTLTTDQIKYAADDAIVAAKIYSELKRRKNRWPFPLILNVDDEIQSFINIPFKHNSANNNKKQRNLSCSLPKSKGRYSKPRKKSMYDNCQLVAPDGELLCSCDRSKAEWYVNKNLGEVINEDPFTVRLNFEPSGRPKLDNVFYTREKLNCCVVCGATENFHCKHVVPSEYRRYFPDLMKKNLSHDVLLLCVDCHKQSNILDQHLRNKLAKMCDAPLGTAKNAKYQFNPPLARIKSAATALSLAGDKIPIPRKQELEKVILDHFQVTVLTEEVLAEACNIDVNLKNESFVPHGLKVYEYFCKNGGIIQLEKLWRQYFLDTMQPKFLPDMWSVDHNHVRLALQVVNHEREIDFDVSILGISPELLTKAECIQEQ
ncbi:exonuclease 3'-5' domain-containing protein 2-like [Stegodyphus dumicola]|uniref:exonuclease 3'-5' domain-containing protein 2-like n=1 Tax=Stegodyphus dumicola TaxID=202533 RepID=UPI0015A77524|nr:exonuclease 3'-5' domain-containing protein 2-like [Stegodyphus dumicola]